MRAMASPRQMRFPVSTGEGRKVSPSWDNAAWGAF